VLTHRQPTAAVVETRFQPARLGELALLRAKQAKTLAQAAVEARGVRPVLLR
jgi:hypothetical protein